jgi:hypothetical protein
MPWAILDTDVDINQWERGVPAARWSQLTHLACKIIWKPPVLFSKGLLFYLEG